MGENIITFREFVDLHQIFSFLTGMIVFALFAKFLQTFGTSAISNQIDAIFANPIYTETINLAKSWFFQTYSFGLGQVIGFGLIYFAIWSSIFSKIYNFIIETTYYEGGIVNDILLLWSSQKILGTLIIALWLIVIGFALSQASTVVTKNFGALQTSIDSFAGAQSKARSVPIPLIVVFISVFHLLGIIVSSIYSHLFDIILWAWNHWIISILFFFFVTYYPKMGSPTEKYESCIKADDVTKLNSTKVQRIFMVKTEEDIINILRLAKTNGVHVSMRGQRHTMGGHTIAADGYVIDMTHFKTIRLGKRDEEKDKLTVFTQPGATWGELIEFLNPYGFSPKTMQSYCSFSVGGTLAVNAHGITSDDSIVTSVLSLRVIQWDGKIIECSRKKNSELFSLVIGGYGLFGVISEVELLTVPNVRIVMESVHLPRDEFIPYYEQILKDKSIEIKLARIDLENPNNIFLFLYRRINDLKIVSDLGDGPRESSVLSQYMFKWLSNVPLFQKFRFAFEQYTQSPVDWAGQVDRTLLVYESVKPFSNLRTLFINLDDTFILQEYFVPHDKFERWVQGMSKELKVTYQHCSLLNITIRYLKKDETTFLPYAKENMFAYVLYWRIPKTHTADMELKEIHSRLVGLTLSLGGVFYLPYRHHYTKEEMQQAYPKIQSFFAKKKIFDPYGIFSNLWYEDYGKQFNVDIPLLFAEPKQHLIPLERMLEGVVPIVSTRREDSYKRIVSSQENKRRLVLFLKFVFNIEGHTGIYNLILKAITSPKNNTDLEIYADLARILDGRTFKLPLSVARFYRSLQQSSEQRTELVQETISIIKNLGMACSIRDYASFGDSGKTVLELKRHLGIQGKIYICHDMARPTDVIERASLTPVGEFVPTNLAEIEANLPQIKEASVDLVTINQGLHHIPQDRLPVFLQLVWNILRPGGVFLFREHDARPDLIPMVDVAHSVFNCILGVPIEEEAKEIRAFRPLAEWRYILTTFGFVDMQMYGIQENDSTEDYMICFIKPPYIHDAPKEIIVKKELSLSASAKEEEMVQVDDQLTKMLKEKGIKKKSFDPSTSMYRSTEWLIVHMCQEFGASMNHTAFYHYPLFKWISLYWDLLFSAYYNIAQEHGWRRALFSSGVKMNGVIGIFFTLIVGLMGVLAKPLDINNSETGYTLLQMLVSSKKEVVEWHNVDHRLVIHPIENINTTRHYYFVEIPPHGPFTEIIMEMIKFDEKSNVELIIENVGCVSGSIGVKVSMSHPRDLNSVIDMGASLVNSYQHPGYGNSLQWYALIGIKVPMLVKAIQVLTKNKLVQVCQIYDFFHEES